METLDVKIEGASELPRATKRRWQPIRSGLVNFYKYDDQTFHFHEGRLLLRGNNGTGKSRVLALQLPFLLDGEMGAERVEPDGDPAKKFEWNLLMGKYEDRTGYTWIEFGRVDEGGEERYVTLGCGVRAVKGRGVASKWFFVTPQRVGREIALCSSRGEPLGKEGLSELISGGGAGLLGENGEDELSGAGAQKATGQGRVFTTASAYREAVNRELFGLSQGRYEALVKLLISLRQPQLARQLDEARLSGALSDSLAPVPAKVISLVADAMRGLEEDRRALEGLTAAKVSADGFLGEYRKYARALAGRRSRELRDAQNAYELKGRHLRQAETRLAEALERRGALEKALEGLMLALAEDEERRQTLEGSPEMKSARDIQKAREDAGYRTREAGTAQERRKGAASGYEAEVQKEGQARARLEAAMGEVIQKGKAARLAAVACGLEQGYETAVAGDLLTGAQQRQRVDKAALTMEAAVRDRRRGIKALGELKEALALALRQLEKMTIQRDQEQERQDEIQRNVVLGGRAVDEAAQRLGEGYRAWQSGLRVLTAAPAHEVVPGIAGWVAEQARMTGPVRGAVEEAVAGFGARVAKSRAERGQERRGLVAQRLEMVEEMKRLKEGVHLPPGPPRTRGEGVRTGRSGAPVWMLCEFHEGVGEKERAGLEAALEGAGLLDAWVNPDGSVERENQVLDTFLVGGALVPQGKPTVTSVLKATGKQGAVEAEVVERVLGSIGLGEEAGMVWVDVDGRWRLGPAMGRWEKPAAEHIGQAAREAARLKRLTELQALVAEMDAKIQAVEAVLAELDQEEQAAKLEALKAPDEGDVRARVARHGALLEELTRAQVRVMEARNRVTEGERAAQEHRTRRDETAADLKLTAWVEKLGEYSELVGGLERQLAGLWPSVAARILSQQALEEQAARVAQALTRLTEADESLKTARERMAGAIGHLETLEQTVGAAVQEVQRRLNDVVARLKSAREEEKVKREELGGARSQVKQFQEAIMTHTAEVEEETLKRGKVIEHFNRFAQTGLLAMATEADASIGVKFTPEMSVTGVVDLARLVGQLVGEEGPSDDAWDQMQQRIHQHVEGLKSALASHEYRPEPSLENEIWVVRVAFRGERIGVEAFARQLAEEIVNREAVLTAGERHVLEDYLIKDIAVVLTELIRDASTLVSHMNKQLAARPTSRGMTLRFKWEASGEAPESFGEAKRRLLGTPGMWNKKDEQIVGAFLQEQIRRMRETPGTWQEQLTAAFDYRQWHAFHIERKLDGDWERLTKRLHGTGSGGEKALALTIPQFAAAAAYYGNEGATAPRLILLDEAFVGIDSDMRAKCMGMLAEFDLDFVMTSEREWGCYATLPGLAIYQLSARAGIDAVWASRWVWNGKERVMDDPDRLATRKAGDLFMGTEPGAGGVS